MFVSIEKAVGKKDLSINALSTQHAKPKAAYAQLRGAIQRTKLAPPNLCIASFVRLLDSYCTVHSSLVNKYDYQTLSLDDPRLC